MIKIHVYSDFDQTKKSSQYYLLSLLSDYLNQKESDIKILRNKNGKPKVKGIEFSLSHSKDKLVIATSFDSKLGVDIEKIHTNKPVTKISGRYFHEQEHQKIQTDKERKFELFYSLWTQKEALCKLEGGRLWFYLKKNLLKSKIQSDKNQQQIYIKTLDEIPNFKLSIASYKNENIQIIHQN